MHITFSFSTKIYTVLKIVQLKYRICIMFLDVMNSMISDWMLWHWILFHFDHLHHHHNDFLACNSKIYTLLDIFIVKFCQKFRLLFVNRRWFCRTKCTCSKFSLRGYPKVERNFGSFPFISRSIFQNNWETLVYTTAKKVQSKQTANKLVKIVCGNDLWVIYLTETCSELL